MTIFGHQILFFPKLIHKVELPRLVAINQSDISNWVLIIATKAWVHSLLLGTSTTAVVINHYPWIASN